MVEVAYHNYLVKVFNSDIIAINTHGRSGLSQLFSESISKELANHALRPIITFKI